MTEVCVCGNVLDSKARVKILRSPCRCERPGPGKTQGGRTGIPNWVGERQYDQRRKLGLPLVTPLERGLFKREF